MKLARLTLQLAAVPLLCCLLTAQQSITTTTSPIVPRLVNYTGKVADAQEKPAGGMAGITFAIYSEQTGGAPLWVETQSVNVDARGNYTAQLGATKPEGLPLEVFTSGEARWMGVRINGGEEQPRVLLLSVPYALKSADAETLGGLPASAFLLAGSAPAATPAPGVSASTPASEPPPAAVTGTGTANYIPLWTSASALGNSALFQTGTGTSSKIGINTTTPTATLDVTGGATIRGLLNLPTSGNSTAAAGTNSRPLGFVASAFNSSTAAPTNEVFHWQAEPVNNNTASASATLNLLFGSAPASPAETGLRISHNGQITFAGGQSFPGTVVGVTAGTDLTGGGSGGTLTLNLDTTKVPQLAAANTFTKPMTVNSSSASGGAINANSADQAVVGTMTALNSMTAAVSGAATATGSGTSLGVEGYSASDSGWGVLGTASGKAGAGVFGQNGTESATFSTFPSVTLLAGASGAWGDGGQAKGSSGVIGTTDDGNAGVFINNSPSRYYTMYINSKNSAVAPFVVWNTGGTADTDCLIDSSADLYCSGTVSGSAVIEGGKRKVALSAIQSPQNWFEDFGSARLVNGVAIVALDPTFVQTVNTAKDYKVFPVPNGDCKGLYVTNKTATSFEVRELSGGTSNVTFDFRITALRKSYENVRFADRTSDPDRPLPMAQSQR